MSERKHRIVCRYRSCYAALPCNFVKDGFCGVTQKNATLVIVE